ncbi:MAG: HAMP domain-containing histidine kinase [Bacilli bacterium]|nr:HAMP domain-containing histidine kinase [Lachnospiraceae bacterium]MCI9435547.1 HAMP domain-containing histidine kinase [Bacilli bacterium]
MKESKEMQIRGKLTCAFLLNMFMPIVLVCGTFGFMYYCQTKEIRQLGIDSATIGECVTNPVKIMNQMTEKDFQKIRSKIEKDSSCMEDIAFLEKYNQRVLWKYSFLVIKKGEEYIYIGQEEKFAKIKGALSKNKEYNSEENSGIYLGNDNNCLVKQCHFQFQDKEKGILYIITDANGFFPAIKSLVIEFLIATLFINGFTAAILILWIYRGVVWPINVLRKATYKMRDGDLNFTVYVEGNDEISALCKDFEEMRMRLKESIEYRIAYEQEMREMMSNISHDLKTPLTAIDGYAEGILDGVANTKEKQERYLRIIYRKAQDMSALVDELSTCSKIENGVMAYHFRNVNLADYFEDGMQEMALELDVRDISLVYENKVNRDVMVEIDPEQMRRVIDNIIGNSVKFIAKRPGIITIRISENTEKEGKFEKGNNMDIYKRKRKGKEEYKKHDKAGSIKVEFRDNGIGIAKEKLPHIFQRFYRVDSSRNSEVRGSGLGLAIAKNILEAHGGCIWAESEEGVGTSIFFTLRRADMRIDSKEEEE